MNEISRGLLAGTLATVPMTLAMRAMQEMLPPREQYPLPPKQITAKLTRKAGVRQSLDEGELNALTMVSHYGYGAAMGGAYALLEPHLPGSAPLKGTLFGLGVWAGSYLGLLPALHLFPPAQRQPGRRNALMIAAHVVYGSGMAISYETLEGR